MTTTELAYDERMTKRRFALDLDKDVAEAAVAMGRRRASTIANEALRRAAEEKEAHHRALLEWLDELNAEFGEPTAEDADYARAAFEELHGCAPAEGSDR